MEAGVDFAGRRSVAYPVGRDLSGNIEHERSPVPPTTDGLPSFIHSLTHDGRLGTGRATKATKSNQSIATGRCRLDIWVCLSSLSLLDLLVFTSAMAIIFAYSCGVNGGIIIIIVHKRFQLSRVQIVCVCVCVWSNYDLWAGLRCPDGGREGKGFGDGSGKDLGR